MNKPSRLSKKRSLSRSRRAPHGDELEQVVVGSGPYTLISYCEQAEVGTYQRFDTPQEAQNAARLGICPLCA